MGTASASVAERMGEAAAAWLAGLTDAQRGVGQFPFPATDERERWYYTPTDHGGLTIAAMTGAQQRAAMKLVASGLSRPAYTTVATIMGLENILDELEGWTASFERERGRDPGMYYLRVFGEPAVTGGWAWRFGGHHVSINVVVLDGEVASTTPCFLGADPANSPLLGGHLSRPLGAVEDLARELVRSLDESQRHAALISAVAPSDLASANRSRIQPGDGPLPLAAVWRGPYQDDTMAGFRAFQERADRLGGIQREHLDAVSFGESPKGVSATTFSSDQQMMLRALMDTYLRRAPDAVAEVEVAKYAGDALRRLSFAWAGSVERGEPHYYRVEGPRLVLEYDNTQRNVNHIHSVWRDPQGDFGMDVLAEHYRSTPH
jgi:hypothetical protein